jgi:hypothetical protein
VGGRWLPVGKHYEVFLDQLGFILGQLAGGLLEPAPPSVPDRKVPLGKGSCHLELYKSGGWGCGTTESKTSLARCQDCDFNNCFGEKKSPWSLFIFAALSIS